MLNRIQQIVSDALDIPLEDLSPQSSSNDFEVWDSLSHLSLILALEEEFRVRFTPEEMIEILSIEAIVLKITEKTSC